MSVEWQEIGVGSPDPGLASHIANTTDVHGIVDTSVLLLQEDLDAHAIKTDGVHGIPLGAIIVTDENIGTYAPAPDLSSYSLLTDVRFTDQRVPEDGSVTDVKVATGAAIAYSKLDLAGQVTVADLSFDPATQSELDAEVSARTTQAGTLVTLTPSSSTRNVIQPTGDFKVLVVRGAGGQNANLQEWQDSTTAILASIGSDGSFVAPSVNGRNAFGGTAASGAILTARSGQVGNFAIVARGTSGQTADLQQWQDSTPSALLSITNTGRIKWNSASNVQTTVGSAGGASALPATPTKYLKVVDNAGTTLVVPAYAA